MSKSNGIFWTNENNSSGADPSYSSTLEWVCDTEDSQLAGGESTDHIPDGSSTHINETQNKENSDMLKCV